MSGMFRQSFDDTSPSQEVEVLGAIQGYTAGRKSVTNTAEVLAAASSSNLSKRKAVLIYNDSNSTTVYFGPTGLTTGGSGTGMPLSPGESVRLDLSDSISVYLKTNAGTVSCIIHEVG